MNMDEMSAGSYGRNYTNTNTAKSTESASFADAMYRLYKLADHRKCIHLMSMYEV